MRRVLEENVMLDESRSYGVPGLMPGLPKPGCVMNREQAFIPETGQIEGVHR